MYIIMYNHKNTCIIKTLNVNLITIILYVAYTCILFKYVVSIDKHDDIFLGMWCRMTYSRKL